MTFTIMDVKDIITMVKEDPTLYKYTSKIDTKVLIECIFSRFPYVDNICTAKMIVEERYGDTLTYNQGLLLLEVLYETTRVMYKRLSRIHGELFLYDSVLVGWLNKHTIVIGVHTDD